MCKVISGKDKTHFMDVSEVREYFEDNGVIFNPFQVEVDSDLHYVSVASAFPDTGRKANDEYRTCLLLRDARRFYQPFHLRSVNDIESIRRESLHALYEQGDAEIFCGSNLYNSRVLYFRKHGNSLFARTDDFLQHKVNISLTEPDNFIAHAKDYLHSLHYSGLVSHC